MAACPPPTPAQPFFTQRLKRGERNLLGPGNTPLLRHSLHYSLASSVGNSLPVGGSAADTCKLHTPGWRFQTFMRPVTYCAQGPHRTCFLATCLPTPFEQSGKTSIKGPGNCQCCLILTRNPLQILSEVLLPHLHLTLRVRFVPEISGSVLHLLCCVSLVYILLTKKKNRGLITTVNKGTQTFHPHHLPLPFSGFASLCWTLGLLIFNFFSYMHVRLSISLWIL
nr:uncharacterized protein LOC105474968 isoform X2 [Macaca nemestrina]